ncbi:MAG: hypothetical protein IJK44_10635 [Bacteroidales bacterium]|nr:hypothetical protein [Bacteroidales bacterium]
MKTITKILAGAAMLLGIMASVSSCSKGDVLNGTTWKTTYSDTVVGVTINVTETFTFNTPNFTYSVSSAASTSSIGVTGKDTVVEGTYSVDGQTVTMTAKDSDGKDVTYTATVDKTILVFDGRTFNKQK